MNKEKMIKEMEEIALTDELLTELVEEAIIWTGTSYYIVILYDFQNKKAWVERRQRNWISPEEFDGTNTFLQVAKLNCQEGFDELEEFENEDDFIDYFLEEKFYSGYEWYNLEHVKDELNRIISILE